MRKHHGDPVFQGKILPGEVKPLAALVGPGSADARPDFLALLVFARGPAVVEDIGWCVVSYMFITCRRPSRFTPPFYQMVSSVFVGQNLSVGKRSVAQFHTWKNFRATK